MIWKDPLLPLNGWTLTRVSCAHRVTVFRGHVSDRNVPHPDYTNQGENGFLSIENPVFLLVATSPQPPCKSQGLHIFEAVPVPVGASEQAAKHLALELKFSH